MSAAQATLPLEFNRPAPRAMHDGSDAAGTGFEIGWDHAHYRLTPPVDHLQPGSPVRQGWEAGRIVFGPRTRQATPHVRKWLQLRLGAWQRGRAFCTLQVTPALLRRVSVPVCPIVREPLVHGTGGPLDASVDRVNNDAGYAAGNLAVMSVRANAAKALLRPPSLGHNDRTVSDPYQMSNRLHSRRRGWRILASVGAFLRRLGAVDDVRVPGTTPPRSSSARTTGMAAAAAA